MEGPDAMYSAKSSRSLASMMPELCAGEKRSEASGSQWKMQRRTEFK